MISTLSKKLLGLEKMVRPRRLKDGGIVVYKGYEPHFQWIQQNQKEIGLGEKLIVYDRCAVDTALEMAARKTKRLSLISTRNYETVVAVAKHETTRVEEPINPPANPKGMFKKTKPKEPSSKLFIDTQISSSAKDILFNHTFSIQNTFLDMHPLQAYHKLCGYLMIRTEQNVLSLFKSFSFSSQPISRSFLILPLLKELRSKYLVVEQLKLGTLDRRSNVTVQEKDIEQALQRWKETVQLKTFQSSYSSFEQPQKLQWVISNKLFQLATKEQLISQRFRRHSYATMD